MLFRSEVINHGPGDIDSFSIVVDDNSDLSSPVRTAQGSLDTGTNGTWSFSWTMEAGQTVYFGVDHTRKVSETDESNNSYDIRLSTLMLPELDIYQVNHSPAITNVNDDIEWTVGIRNSGPGYVRNDFHVGMYDTADRKTWCRERV